MFVYKYLHNEHNINLLLFRYYSVFIYILCVLIIEIAFILHNLRLISYTGEIIQIQTQFTNWMDLAYSNINWYPNMYDSFLFYNFHQDMLTLPKHAVSLSDFVGVHGLCVYYLLCFYCSCLYPDLPITHNYLRLWDSELWVLPITHNYLRLWDSQLWVR